MELRKQIADIIIDHVGNKALEEADVILSLPSGMEKVKECNCVEITNGVYKHCTYCNDSGEIVTDLTVGEAIEIMPQIVLAIYALYDNHLTGDKLTHIENSIILSSGERIRVKK